jgi:hypothetical protein
MEFGLACSECFNYHAEIAGASADVAERSAECFLNFFA